MSINQYDYGEYEEEPLLFSKLQLNIEEKYNLIYAFSQWYGDTAQDSEEFAFEFLVVTRSIMGGDIVMNPKYLLLDDCLEELVELLPEDERGVYKEDYYLVGGVNVREKIISVIELIKQDYYNGNINSTEYHDQLNGLNRTIFEMDRYQLLDEVNPGEMQEIIHQAQESFCKDLRESMKEPGVNVIFNGYIHHFDDPAWFDTFLGRMADSVHEMDKNDSVLYDDELNFNFRKEGKRYGKNTKKSPSGF